MSTSKNTQWKLQDVIDADARRDRLVRWTSILSWTVTFLVLVGFGITIGQDVFRTLRLGRVGMLPDGAVLRALVPLFLVVGTTTLLLALVSTAAIFLRQRTASLADIQIRLATLEAIMAREVEDDLDDPER